MNLARRTFLTASALAAPGRSRAWRRVSAAVISPLQRAPASRWDARSRAARTRSRTTAELSPGSPPRDSAVGWSFDIARDTGSAHIPLAWWYLLQAVCLGVMGLRAY